MPRNTSITKHTLLDTELHHQEQILLNNSTFLHQNNAHHPSISSPGTVHPNKKLPSHFHARSSSKTDLPALSLITQQPHHHQNALLANTREKRLLHSPTPHTNHSLSLGSERGGMKSSMRNFSKMVCQKLEEVVITSYNEISDTLVQEFSLLDARTDQKNIRRRVYDVLNVLNSMGIIEKDKRRIRWVGFPEALDSCNEKWEAERAALQERVQEKKKALQLYLQRYVALNKLIQRNKAYEFHMQSSNELICESVGSNGSHSSSTNPNATHQSPCSSIGQQDKLFLPFILISAPKDCRIDCEMLEDRTQYFFEFDMPFTIHEDMEVLKLLNLDRVTKQDLFSLLSPQVAKYYPEELCV